MESSNAARRGPGAPQQIPPAPASTPVVVVDDDPGILKAVQRVLEGAGYPVLAFGEPDAALARLREGAVAILITDLVMPGMSGLELTRHALGSAPDLAVILMTGRGDEATAAQALRLGVWDYLQKPFGASELEASVRNVLVRRALILKRHGSSAKLREAVALQAREIQQSRADVQDLTTGVLMVLAGLMDERFPWLEGNSRRVSRVAADIASVLDLAPDDVDDVRIAGMLHDIGMVSMPDDIMKKPGPLSGEEYEVIKEHPRIGAELLAPLRILSRASEYVLFHHERVNGSGYPDGLTGAETPLGAQIVGVAESYSTLIEVRPFRPPVTTSEALETLRMSEGVWFDSDLLDALARVVATG
jgi:response regulator RpfG family c-di-GMP phosphodiesterase